MNTISLIITGCIVVGFIAIIPVSRWMDKKMGWDKPEKKYKQIHPLKIIEQTQKIITKN